MQQGRRRQRPELPGLRESEADRGGHEATGCPRTERIQMIQARWRSAARIGRKTTAKASTATMSHPSRRARPERRAAGPGDKGERSITDQARDVQQHRAPGDRPFSATHGGRGSRSTRRGGGRPARTGGPGQDRARQIPQQIEAAYDPVQRGTTSENETDESTHEVSPDISSESQPQTRSQ